MNVPLRERNADTRVCERFVDNFLSLIYIGNAFGYKYKLLDGHVDAALVKGVECDVDALLGIYYLTPVRVFGAHLLHCVHEDLPHLVHIASVAYAHHDFHKFV